MYNALFKSDNGEQFVFGLNGSNVFDMDVGKGIEVNLGKSMTFANIGESVENKSAGGRIINVKGSVFGNVPAMKIRLSHIFNIKCTGTLIIDGRYYTRVHVKSCPSFSPVRDDGRFTMQLFAPLPYFFRSEKKNELIGEITPLHGFPIKYSVPHGFGEMSGKRTANIYNDGDVEIPFALHLRCLGTCNNIVISNLKTLEYFKIKGSFIQGDSIDIYRDEDNILRAEKTAKGITTDIMARVERKSNLFYLNVGDNLISVVDDSGGANLEASFSYNTAVVAVYES